MLELRKEVDTATLYDAIEAAGWRVTLRVNGREVPTPLNRLPDNAHATLIIHGMTREREVLANNIASLLAYNGGRFLGEMPRNFYLIEEDYAAGEVPVHAHVAQYQRVLRVVEFIREIADDVREASDADGYAVFLTNRKVGVPLIYKHWDLDHVGTDTEIDEIFASVFNQHHEDARKDIARRAIVRMLAGVAREDRFSSFVRSLRHFKETYLADFDIYASAFNFDNARDDFERKKLDYVVKLNSIATDAMGKLIAIPVAQGLLASQIKPEAAMAVANQALLVASFIFAAIAIIIILSYSLSIHQIESELKSEVKLLKSQSRLTYEKLKPVINRLELRICIHLWGIPVIMVALLCVTTAMTYYAYSAIAVTTST
ncbi:hypothetical protein [Salinisphaera sp. T31B1]|uniref:hypothetical protein n=1 Tax=Salinisphaera sp. T31B1 TaxID=727963 RepID=UPI00334294C2